MDWQHEQVSSFSDSLENAYANGLDNPARHSIRNYRDGWSGRARIEGLQGNHLMRISPEAFDPLTRGKSARLFGKRTQTSALDDILTGKSRCHRYPCCQVPRNRPVRRADLGATLSASGDSPRLQAAEYRPVFLWEDEAHDSTIDQDALVSNHGAV